jgi:hypothetical protein
MADGNSEGGARSSRDARAGAQRAVRRTAWSLFGSLAAFYCLLGQGTITGYDEGSMLEVTKSLVRSGSFDVPPNAGEIGRDGRYYSRYGIGQSIGAVPFYAIGLAAGRVAATRGVPPGRVADAAVSFFGSFVTAATAAVVFLLALEFDAGPRVAVGCALIYGLATLALPYAKFFFSDPLCTLLLLLAALQAVRLSPGAGGRNSVTGCLWAGTFLGLAISVRIAAAIPALVLVCALLLREGRQPRGHWPNVRAVAAVLGPILTAAALIGAYNAWRFGSPIKTGYPEGALDGAVPYGLYVLLLSPGRGFFLYSPILVLGAIGFPHLIRIRPFVGWLLAALVTSQVLFYATYRYPEGGWSYGPRLLLPAVPFCLLPLAVELPRWKGWLRTAAVGSLVGTSFLVQLPAVCVHPSRHTYRLAIEEPSEFFERMIRRPADAHIFALWADMGEVVWNALHDRARLKAMAVRQLRAPETALNLDERGVLAARVTLNAPNFWWLTSYYAGVPARAIASLALALLVVLLASAWTLMRQLQALHLAVRAVTTP